MEASEKERPFAWTLFRMTSAYFMDTHTGPLLAVQQNHLGRTFVDKLQSATLPTKEAARARDLGSAGPLKDIFAPRGSVISGSTFFPQ